MSAIWSLSEVLSTDQFRTKKYFFELAKLYFRFFKEISARKMLLKTRLNKNNVVSAEYWLRSRDLIIAGSNPRPNHLCGTQL